MSNQASRYADYPSASPRCQQIIQTIDLTSQQGVFIYDLTFIQEELEALLIAAIQREDELQRSNGENLTLPQSSFVRLANGKKPRDFKAERERRRKAFAGQLTRKRRRRKDSTQRISRERTTWKKHRSTPNFVRTEIKSNRPIRAFRSMNFGSTASLNGETKTRNLSTIEQFWANVIEQHREIFTDENLKSIENLIEIDEKFLKNLHEEIPDKILWKETIVSSKDYVHPELQHSIVLKQNEIFHQRVQMLNKKYPSLNTISRNKIKNLPNIDENILAMLRRDDPKFSSKNAELEHRLMESIRLERFALAKAKEEVRRDAIRVKLMEIEEKVVEITNSIRQRKRPSELVVSQTTPLNPSNETEPWRKGRRQSTLRVYDELARLIDKHIEFDRQIIEIESTSDEKISNGARIHENSSD